ncbi:DUF3566 domain-containing protein [Lentzea sp. NPDC004789]
MTPPDNREGRDADKTAVITKPTSKKSGEKAAEATPAASGSSGGDTTKPVSAEKAADAAAPEPPATPAAPAEEKTVAIDTPAPAPAAEPAAPVAAEEPVVVSAPPPWQRVTNDTDAAQQDSTEAYVAPAAPPVPTPEPAFPQTDPDTVKVQKPVVTGSAVPVGLGSSRTSVNLGNSAARPAAATPSARRPGRGPRRASLQVKRVDPWSVLKLALVLGVALFFVWLVAVGVLYGVLHGMGVWDKINSTANDLLQANEPGEPLISAGRVFGVSAIIGAVNIVLFTALATVGAFVYNVSADLAGGLELTLSERE